jgi:signal transduction histidine kinase
MVKSFEIDIPENLPQIFTDPEALEQILINLLINAAQAADKEDSWIKLRIALGNTRRERWIIEVNDNGCGMDVQTREKIFDVFFTTKTLGKGMGLGLYVCQTLVEGLGGQISVESEQGKGSAFRLVLSDINCWSVERMDGQVIHPSPVS